MNTTARLIVFEGVDAAGKSTISDRVHASLIANHIPTSLLSFPGKSQGTIGELVYRLHHEPQKFGVEQLTPTCLQALHIAAHFDAIQRVIVPRLENGETVILDRYWWSTWAYGVAGGVDTQILDLLIQAEIVSWSGWTPAALFYVTRRHPLRDEVMEKWTACKSAYETLIKRESGRYPVHIIENETQLEDSVKKVLELCSH